MQLLFFIPPPHCRPKKATPEFTVLPQSLTSSGPRAGSSMPSSTTYLKLFPRKKTDNRPFFQLSIPFTGWFFLCTILRGGEYFGAPDLYTAVLCVMQPDSKTIHLSIKTYCILYEIKYSTVACENEFCFELQIRLIKVGFVSKTRQRLKFRICLKMENLMIVLKAVKGFNTKRTPSIILI